MLLFCKCQLCIGSMPLYAEVDQINTFGFGMFIRFFCTLYKLDKQKLMFLALQTFTGWLVLVEVDFLLV